MVKTYYLVDVETGTRCGTIEMDLSYPKAPEVQAATAKQNRHARVLIRDIGMTDGEYTTMKYRCTGKRHMLTGHDPMNWDEATKVINALKAILG